MVEFIQKYKQMEIEREAREKSRQQRKWLEVIRLKAIRARFLQVIAQSSQLEHATPPDPMFETILVKAQQKTSSWAGKLVFVCEERTCSRNAFTRNNKESKMRLRQKKIHLLEVKLAVLLFLLSIEARGQTWISVGEGVDGGVTLTSVNALHVYNNELYAGGDFYSAGTTEANFIAKWDGSQWISVGTGVYAGAYQGILALAEFNGELYAGGDFSRAGDAIVNYIAKWNGQSWSSVGSGTNQIVVALAVYKNELYASGIFTMAGGTSAQHIARWDGTAWKSVGEGINNNVFCLQIYDNELYVGGDFVFAGGVNTSGGIAKWDGTRWSPVGIAGKKSQPTQVRTLAVYKNELCAGGTFTNEQGQEIHAVAKWDGSQWNLLGNGFNGYVKCLKVFDGRLYAAGRFDKADGNLINFVAQWNDTTWSPIGSGMNGPVNALALYKNQLYAGGEFTVAGGVPANRIAKSSFTVNIKDNRNNQPLEHDLFQNYPNPFNPATTIKYTLPKPSFVKLAIYDVAGQEVRTLVNEFQRVGVKSTAWDGKNDGGQPVPSGVYIYRIVAGEFTQSSKLVIVK